MSEVIAARHRISTIKIRRTISAHFFCHWTGHDTWVRALCVWANRFNQQRSAEIIVFVVSVVELENNKLNYVIAFIKQRKQKKDPRREQKHHACSELSWLKHPYVSIHPYVAHFTHRSGMKLVFPVPVSISTFDLARSLSHRHCVMCPSWAMLNAHISNLIGMPVSGY